MALQAIRYESGKLTIIDLLLLPHETVLLPVTSVEDAWTVTRKMQVRGAPAIAIVGCLSLASELGASKFDSPEMIEQYIHQKLDYLVTARPTAVNMKNAATRLKKKSTDMRSANMSADQIREKIVRDIEDMFKKDIEDNRAVGKYGADAILNAGGNTPVRILTHCNTGSLATAGYGTALGVARALQERGKLEHIYCTETRPYNQGARLTAYEIVHDKMPGTLICDSMAATLMERRDISAVVVGADRVVSNGDTANKIGTLQLAITAKHFNVPFYVAAPSSSCDLILATGMDIEIEERPHAEMKTHHGVPVAPKDINCWNPAFDVTPHALITGIVTEVGVFTPADLKEGLLTVVQTVTNLH